nr:PREDICTED: taste receptor type 2 member 9-like [Anolis carolinensis]|eukprot:XP_016846315.1 PREDICTED: taste receptor type 2 member 9-like [Anolis carolinensis]
MASPNYIAFLVIEVVLVISGLIFNGFIVMVMITQWIKYRRLASCEQLILSLGLSNLWVTIVFGLFHSAFSHESEFSSLNFQIWYSIFFFCITFRYWLTALLCFFYFIKLVNSSHAFFLWCKLRISWLIPRSLMGSLIISLFVFIVIVSNMYTPSQESPATNTTTVTQGKSLKDILTKFDVLFSTIGSGCPFLVVFLCSILVVVSLCGHVCQMRSKESHLRSFQAKAHIQATWTVISLLLLFLSFFVAQTLSMTVDIGYNGKLFIFTVMSIYSPAQAVILVLNNPKLKQALAVMVQRTQS